MLLFQQNDKQPLLTAVSRKLSRKRDCVC